MVAQTFNPRTWRDLLSLRPAWPIELQNSQGYTKTFFFEVRVLCGEEEGRLEGDEKEGTIRG